MKRTLLAACALGGLGIAGAAIAGQTAVSLTATGPQPPVVTVAVGDTVAFQNADKAVHTIAAKRSGLPATALQPGQAYSFVPTKTGTIRYSESGAASGTLVVTAAKSTSTTTTAAALSLSATRPFVAYGHAASLHGHSPQPGQTVTIQRRVQGVRQWTQAAQVAASETGAFTAMLHPERGTQYRALLGSGKTKVVTPPVSVAVKPRVTLAVSTRAAKSGHPVAVTITVTPRTAATSVNLMRYNRSIKSWVKVDSHLLDPRGRALIQWPAVPGYSLLRGWLSTRTIHSGYLVAFSTQLSVKGVGALPVKVKKHAKTGGGGHHGGHGKHAKTKTTG